MIKKKEDFFERKRVIKFGEAGYLIVPEIALLFFDESTREALKGSPCVIDEQQIEEARADYRAERFQKYGDSINTLRRER